MESAGSIPTQADCFTTELGRANFHDPRTSLPEVLRDISTDMRGEGWGKSASVVELAAAKIERSARAYQSILELYSNATTQRNAIQDENARMREELLKLRGEVGVIRPALEDVVSTLENETDGDCGLSAESSERLLRRGQIALNPFSEHRGCDWAAARMAAR